MPPITGSGRAHLAAVPPLAGGGRAHLATDVFAFWVLSLGQCLIFFSVLAQAETIAAKLQPALVALLTSVGLLISSLAPRFYWRHRNWLLGCLRIAVLLVPSARATKVGSSLVLEREPRTGRLGFLADVVRLSYGNRVILVCAQGLVQVLPPLPALITQAAAAALTANSQGYCQTALMSHPITRRRLADTAVALEAGSALPLAAVVPLGQVVSQLGIVPGEAASEPVCRATLTFFHIAGGVVLPMLVSVRCWVAPRGQPPPPPTDAPPASTRKRLLQRLAAAAAAAEAAANGALHCLFSGGQWGWAAWWLLALTWVCSKTAAGLL